MTDAHDRPASKDASGSANCLALTCVPPDGRPDLGTETFIHLNDYVCSEPVIRFLAETLHGRFDLHDRGREWEKLEGFKQEYHCSLVEVVVDCMLAVVKPLPG